MLVDTILDALRFGDRETANLSRKQLASTAGVVLRRALLAGHEVIVGAVFDLAGRGHTFLDETVVQAVSVTGLPDVINRLRHVASSRPFAPSARVMFEGSRDQEPPQELEL